MGPAPLGVGPSFSCGEPVGHMGSMIRRRGALLLAALALGAAAPSEGETGYDLWLRYVRVEDEAQRTAYRKAARAIVVEDDSPTGRVVRAELRRGLRGLLGSEGPVSKAVGAEGTVVVG